jgi:Sulfotransferase domain
VTGDRASLPTFIVIGAMKAGTTTLWTHLDRHPQVFMSRPKEPQFFSQEWDRGLGWYQQFFAKAGSAVARGEASTTYTRFPRKPETAERMASVVPDARLIYLIRDPVNRMRSHWLHNVAEELETRPIAEALFDPRYVDRSSFAMQVEQYLRWFPREQIRIVESETLFGQPASTVASLFEFIGADPDVAVTDHMANSAEGRFGLSPHVRNRVKSASSSRLYRAVPRPVRRLVSRPVRKALARPMPDATVPDALRTALLELLADDQARLRELMAQQPALSA